jgi:hypothetical protein
VPYEELPRRKIELPKRQKAKSYVPSEHPLRIVPDVTADLDAGARDDE